MKKAKHEWKRTSVLLTQDQWKQINKICKVEKRRKSEFIREIITSGLVKWGLSRYDARG